jgi:prophage regulatory protein
MAMTEATNTALTVFLRLPQVLEIIPVSKSTWWAGIRAGKFPKAVKLTQRTSAWRLKDIEDLCVRLSGTDESEGGR